MNAAVEAIIAEHTDWPGFRRQARALLMAKVPPERVVWRQLDAPQNDLFAAAADENAIGLPVAANAALVPAAAMPRVPPQFIAACQRLILHADAERLPLMYRLLWRLQREPTLRADALDPDVQAARRMVRAVGRDVHRFYGFLRFRPVGEASLPSLPSLPSMPPGDSAAPCEGACWHIAWFEPKHHTLVAAAPFFTRRFARQPWAILTPLGSALWDTQTLRFGPPAPAHEAPPADAGEALWLTYYANTFNPQRLKLAAMRNGMPRHYWKNMPEAALITPLAGMASMRLM